MKAKFPFDWVDYLAWLALGSLLGCSVQIRIGGTHGGLASENARSISDTIRDGVAGEEVSVVEARASGADSSARR